MSNAQELRLINDYQIPKIGRRVSLHGNRGTIKYIGEVQGTNGTWLGVEWDDPRRGKHSGEKGGRQYFACSVPGSGSFIRPSPAISYGQSFLSALVSKYVESPHSSGQKETVFLGSSSGAIEVEAIGLDKVRGKLARLEHLREISLDAEEVAYADSLGEITRTCPNVRSLDLSNTLLASWDSVAVIASELPALRELSLNSNRLSSLNDTTNLRSAFMSLEEIRLNETFISWAEVVLLLTVMPNLRVIELGYNNMERLGGTEFRDQLSGTKLEVLNLDENKLHDWNDVMEAIAPFEKLSILLARLISTANRLQRIPQTPTTQIALPNIKHLGLQDNLISKWRDIDSLNVWLPNLKTLNMNGNPIFSPRNSQMSAEERTREFPRWNELCASKYLRPISIRNAICVKLKTIIYVCGLLPRAWRAREECRKSPRYPGRPTHNADAHNLAHLHHFHSTTTDIYVHRCEKTAEPDSHVILSSAASSAQALMAQLPPPSTLRVLPTMPVRLLRPRLLKSLNLFPYDRSRRQGPELSVWLVMDDDGLREIGKLEGSRDLSWWGIQDGSHILVCASQTDHD
ncbi:RNI-like protein [Sanghuangporus baumii]|uniref:RNI-like protein n=1 Tax=Sanghuangporus baumii TaxID=108892 RepID=A0A9Q5N8Q6_SANBA|nr:RNI-like protein [Sanghuangporus baumii]